MSSASRFAKKLTVQLLLGSVVAGLVSCTPNAEVSTEAAIAPTRALSSASETPDNPAVQASSEADNTIRDIPSPESVAEPAAISQVNSSDWAREGEPDVNCNDRQTQLAMNICSGRDYRAADAELNQVYQALILQQSDSGKAALETAELAWLSFRDIDCTFSKSFYEGGSIAPLIYNSCLEARTVNRTQELRQPQAGNRSYAMADADLNSTYQLLIDKTNETRKDPLVDTQLAWLEYRDRNCAFEARYRPVAINEDQCLARMTETRLQQLQNHVDLADL